MPPLASPAPRMPGQYWAFGFYMLLSAPLLVGVFAFSFRDASSLSTLAGLPITGRLVEEGPEGTVFQGSLAGTTRSTPLGEGAVAWIGVVKESHKSGKSSVTSEKCRLGSLDGLELVGPAGRASIAPREPSEIDPETGTWSARTRQPIWWLGAATEWSPLPPAIVEQCHLEDADLSTGTWTYVEHRASAGAAVEIAGCLRAGAIDRCASGPADGHVAVGGMRGLILRLADSTMGVTFFGAALLSAFTIIAGVGALSTLRRAARESGGVL